MDGRPGGTVAVALFKDGDGGLFRLWKLTGSGLFDYGYGTGGYVTRKFGDGGTSFAHFLDSFGTDDVVVGSWFSESLARLGVTRLLADGSYHAIGSMPGHVLHKVFTYEHDYLEPFSSRVLDNGRLMVAVAAFDFNTSGELVYVGQAIIKLNQNGTKDQTFSGDGVLPVAKDVLDISFGPDGSSFLGRQVGNSHEIRKFTPAGSLNATFSSDGAMIIPCGVHFGASLVADATGGVLAVCHRESSGHPDLRPIHVTAAGVLDPAYSGNGMAPLLIPEGNINDYEIEVDGLAVYAIAADSVSPDYHLYSLDETGAPNPIFGSDGAAQPPLDGNLLESEIVEGRIIVATESDPSDLDLYAILTQGTA